MIVGAVQVACRLARAGQHVQRSGLGIDDRSRSDADDGNNEGAVYGIGGDRSDAFGTGEADLPQRRRGIAFGIEGVDGVVFRSDVDDVVRAFPWNLYARDVEGLGVNVAIHSESENLAELFGDHVLRRERFFAKVGAGAGVVVLRGRDLRWCARAQGKNCRQNR